MGFRVSRIYPSCPMWIIRCLLGPMFVQWEVSCFLCEGRYHPSIYNVGDEHMIYFFLGDP